MRVAELVRRRTETTSSYRLSDGTVEMVASASPVHYRTSTGRWADLDTAVVAGTGPTRFVNRTNIFDTAFGGSSEDLVSVTAGSQAITLGLPGAARPMTPDAHGSEVLYGGAFGSADLRYRVGPGAVKEEVVLPDATTPAGGFAFTVRTNGLQPRRLAGGQVGFFARGTSNSANPRFVMPAPYMTDHGGDRSEAVTQQLDTAGGLTTVTLLPDRSWLTAAGRQFPVVVDPTIVAAPDPTGAKDALVFSGAPTTPNGASPLISVGTDASHQAYRGLFQFDTSMIPAGTKVRAARLNLHMNSPFNGDANTIPMTAYEVTAPWDEATATWSSMSTAFSSVLGSNQIVLDDTDIDNVSSGPWKDVANAAAEGGTLAKLNAGTGPDTFVWNGRVPWPGTYRVDVHYVPAAGQGSPTYVTTGDTGVPSSTATIDQTSGATTGVWRSNIATMHFSPNQTTSVKMTRQAGTTATAPVADAVRWTETATATKQPYERDDWSSFGVGTIVQDWLEHPENNHGFMVKANDESPTGPVGGPNYQASEDAFNSAANRPQLVVVYGAPGPGLSVPTTIHSDGAELSWSAYHDPSSDDQDDLVDYQIYRACITLPSGACASPAPGYYTTAQSAGLELIGTVASDVTSFTDTSATASTGTATARYRYWVVARTVADSQGGGPGTGASNSVDVTIPREGREVDVFTGNIADTTLSAAQPSATKLEPDSANGATYRHWLQVGNSHATYGDERAVMEFDTTSTIKATVKVTDAHLELWQTNGAGSGATFALHALNRDFDESTASWNQPDPTSTWTGGDYDATTLDSITATNNVPKALTFASTALTSKVQSWVAAQGDNHGLLLKTADETASQQWIGLVASESNDNLFLPKLYVEHLVKDQTQIIEANQLPERFVPGTTITTPVTVTNTTGVAWPGGLQLSYRWTDPGSSVDKTVEGDRNYIDLGRALDPGESVERDLSIRVPINSDTGANSTRKSYDLYLDLWDKATSSWFSNDPVNTPFPSSVDPVANRPSQGCLVTKSGLMCVDRYVEDPTSNMLGLEKFLSYAGEETGGGPQALVNLASGNLAWSYDAISNPSLGPSTFVRLAYNSLDATDPGTGWGVSVQPGTLVRLGSRLSVPTGNSVNNLMTFVDGDGTTHVYKVDDATGTPNKLEYDRPAGIAIDLWRDTSTGVSADRAWVFARPDGTRFYFNRDTGLQTATVDHNGNTLTYHYDTSNRLTSLTDATGRTTLTLGYEAGNATSLSWIRDISGRALKFKYDPSSHMLTTLQDGPGFDPAANSGAGGYADTAVVKSFNLGYNTTSANSGTRLTSVTDPLGHTSAIAYWGNEVPDSSNVGWAKSFTDRRGNATTYDYADGNPANAIFCTDLTTVSKETCANVTDRNGATDSVTTYRMDGYGRTIAITDANANAGIAGQPGGTTRLGWDRDHNVIRLEEPNGAVSTWEYDPATGYPLVIKDAETVKNNEAGVRLHYHQETGTNQPWVLDSKTSAAGRKDTFTYDPNGNLLTVTNGLNITTQTYTYNADGTLATAKDANSPAAIYGTYDANGLPLKVTDPLGHATDLTYDNRGNPAQVTDALHEVTTAEYDGYGRPTKVTTPGAGNKPDGTPTTRTTATTYDLNDNTRTTTAPNGAVTTDTYDAADNLLTKQIPDNNTTGRTLTYTYDPLGRLSSETAPIGTATSSEPNDYVTRYTYDRDGDQIKVDTPFLDTDGTAKTATWTYTYDIVGNQVQTRDPRKNASTGTDYTTKTSYDRDHRPVAVTDAAGYTTRTEYDADGLTTAQIDALGNRQRTVYDAAGQLTEVHTPHTANGATSPRDQVTQFVYNPDGTRRYTIRPTGGYKPGDGPSGNYTETIYDADNQPTQTKSAFKPGDAHYATPASTYTCYDDVGRKAAQSVPTYTALTCPAGSGSSPQWTTYDYFSSGDIKTTTDPWNLVTAYDYNSIGQQTGRTFKSATDSAVRSQSWDYYPDGSLKSKVDTAAPQVTDVIDSGDTWQRTWTGTWSLNVGGTNVIGPDYRSHAAAAAGTAAAGDTFTWTFAPDTFDTFDVYASCPVRSDASTAAPYTVNSNAGASTVTINQKACTASTPWVKLGTWNFNAGVTKTVVLKPATSGVVSADAIKFVPTSTAASKTYDYTYDANGQQTQVVDGRAARTYSATYDGLGRTKVVTDNPSTGTGYTIGTNYTYDLDSNPTSIDASRSADPNDTTTHPASRYTAYTWDPRNLLDTVKTGATSTTANAVFAYTYTARGQRATLTKPNGNVTSYSYYEDGLVHTANERTSKDPNGFKPVALHTLDYNADGDKTLDISKIDQANSTGTIDQTANYTYTPTEKLESANYTGADPAKKESYVYDAAGNITSQTIGSTTTTMNYDRNRLTSTTTAGTTLYHRYDPFGRETQITTAGAILGRYAWDGWDRQVREQHYDGSGSIVSQKSNGYDPFDRTTTQTLTIPGQSAISKRFTYLGLADQVAVEEQKDTAGTWKVAKTYAYGPAGDLLQLINTPVNATTTKTYYYGTNPHGDVETLTDATTGQTTSTYRYTAYGQTDTTGTTGDDAPSTATGSAAIEADADMVNPYRFNSKRYEGATGTYDMGFREYDPGINQYLSRDMYNGALEDMALDTDPWTTNRYAFAGGNPTTLTELDGHISVMMPDSGGANSGNNAGDAAASPTATPSQAPDAQPSGRGTTADGGDEGQEDDSNESQSVRDLTWHAPIATIIQMFGVPCVGVAGAGGCGTDALQGYGAATSWAGRTMRAWRFSPKRAPGVAVPPKVSTAARLNSKIRRSGKLRILGRVARSPIFNYAAKGLAGLSAYMTYTDDRAAGDSRAESGSDAVISLSAGLSLAGVTAESGAEICAPGGPFASAVCGTFGGLGGGIVGSGLAHAAVGAVTDVIDGIFN